MHSMHSMRHVSLRNAFPIFRVLLLSLLAPASGLRTVADEAPGERPEGSTVAWYHQIPHRRLMLVVYPAMAVAAVLLLVLVVIALRSSREETLPNKTRRQSLKVNRLMVRLGASGAVEVLHPETTLVEDFRQAFTWTRLGVFWVAILLSFALAVFGDSKLFMMKHSVGNIASMEACEAACHADPTAQCGLNDIKFEKVEKKSCELSGTCKEDVPSPTVEFVKCTFNVAPEAWKVDLVLVSAIVGIYLIVEGLPAELILFGLNCIYGILGIISVKQVWGGLASGSVVGLALLFPIAAAIEETGVLDVAIGVMLGNPQSFIMAFFRMLIPVALLSAFLSNTAIVTMMIPVIVSWSRTLGEHPGKLLMPLSFAAQLGGSCTLIGSSHCLVARESVDKTLYEMSFFDLSYSGTILCLSTFVLMALSLPFLASSAAAAETVLEDDVNQENLYLVKFTLRRGSSYVGLTFELASIQLKRLPGVRELVRNPAAGDVLKEDEELKFLVDETGVTSLRQIKGLCISSEDALWALGMERERRHLYEVSLSPSSELLEEPLDFDVMRQVFGACPIAIRGKESDIPVAGDIVLLEADERYVGTAMWQEEFSITRIVPNSSPQRVGGVHDKLRCVLVCLGMATLIALVTLEVVDLSAGAGIFVLLLVLSNAYSMSSVYRNIKGPVLLTIAGASGLSAALQGTGIAMFAAKELTKCAMPYGPIGIRAAVYFLCAFLTMFMNNSATVAIIGPMLATIARSTCAPTDITCQQKSTKALAHVMTFAAGTCLTSPLGYQTNLMVMKDGGYTFADFAKYGGLVQVFHLICCVLVVSLLVDMFDL